MIPKTFKEGVYLALSIAGGIALAGIVGAGINYGINLLQKGVSQIPSSNTTSSSTTQNS